MTQQPDFRWPPCTDCGGPAEQRRDGSWHHRCRACHLRRAREQYAPTIELKVTAETWIILFLAVTFGVLAALVIFSHVRIEG